ncbi:GNAT family protein [Micromonospora echinofusca]|uniref:GNAT family N-acetyltransferase n=1 Tax=Micromonospora echinofusca TaxID=47858 RepID=UPI00340B098C
MLKGRLIGLRPVHRDDLDLLADLANAGPVRSHVVGWGWPVSRDGQENWFQGGLQARGSCRLSVTDLATDEAVGITGLWEIDWHNRSGLTAIKLMPGRTPRGAGSDAIKLVMAWSFYEVGLRRLHSTILNFNAASLGAYVRRSGWRIEGRHREAVFRRGQWHDLYSVAALRDDFDVLEDAEEYVERVCGTAVPAALVPEGRRAAEALGV